MASKSAWRQVLVCLSQGNLWSCNWLQNQSAVFFVCVKNCDITNEYVAFYYKRCSITEPRHRHKNGFQKIGIWRDKEIL